MAENYTIFDHPEDTLAALVIFVPSLIGLLTYVIVILTIYKTREFSKNPYYLLAAALGVLDSILLVGMIVYTTPCILLQTDLGGQTVNGLVGAILLVGWFAAFPLNCALALNRYYCICHKGKYKLIFTLRNTNIIIACCVLFGIICGIVTSFPCCNMLLFPDLYSWAWNIDMYGSWVWSYFDLVSLCFTVFFAGTCNFIVFRSYYRLHRQIAGNLNNSRQQATRREREFKLFIQFFIIMAYLTIFDFFFNVTPYFSSSKWLYLVISFMYVLNSSINAYVYILMSPSLRRGALNLMTGRKPEVASSAVFVIKDQLGATSRM